MKRRYTKRVDNKMKGVIRANEKLILLTLVFILGLLTGSYIFKTAQPIIAEILQKIISDTVKVKSSQSILNNFFSYLLPDIIAIVILSVFGLSALGEPVICIVPYIRGLGIGLTVACLYKSFGVDGLLFTILLIILPSAFCVSSIIICCKENLITSAQIRKRLRSNQSDQAFDYRLFLLRNGILSAVIVICSVFGSMLCYLTADRISPQI